MKLRRSRCIVFIITSILIIQCVIVVMNYKRQKLANNSSMLWNQQQQILDVHLPHPLEEFFKLSESEQKRFYDGFIKQHPQMQSRHLTGDDVVAAAPSKITRYASLLRDQIFECMGTTNITQIPRYEDDQEQWWSSSNEFCRAEYFQIFRREQNLSKALYCLAKRPDISTFLDMWAGFGGTALTIAAGLTSSGDGSKKLYSFEANPNRALIVTNRLKGYPFHLIFDTSLIPYTYHPKNPADKPAGGSLIQLCKSKYFNAIFLDAVGIHGTKWETHGTDGTVEHNGQEFFVARDFCRPKYLIATITGELNEWLKHTVEKHNYEIVIEGETKGMGCSSVNTSYRRWVILLRKDT